jgi:hypothetical protein
MKVSDNNWIILLTTAVSNPNNTFNKESRINMYNNSILKWLKYTNYKIVLVESSGYDFPDITDERLF